MPEWFTIGSALLALAVAGSMSDADTAGKRCTIVNGPIIFATC